MKISLDGEWTLRWIENDQSTVGEIPAELESSFAIRAQVPGNVELDLVQAGLLPDPFLGATIRELRRLENRDWWYEKQIQVPAHFAGKRTELVFEGLDTLATIWVNGQQVGHSDNMLIAHHFEVTEALKPGEANTLVVRLASAMAAARNERYEPGMMSWEHRTEGLRLRKAPHVWGWDILPRVVSAGIWRPAYLQTIPEHAIEGLYTWTIEAKPDHATLGIWYNVRTPLDTQNLRLVVSGSCEEQKFEYEWPLEFTADQFSIPIDHPKLWWPAGYGKANLYSLKTQLCRGEEVLAERVEKIGIRKISLQRTEGPSTRWQPPLVEDLPAKMDRAVEENSHFYLRVNDQPIMIKGTNWVPLDAFHSRDGGRLKQALEMATELGVNMIRCWGGNVYEADAFFDGCDAGGILVWQDFAFACCIYPQDEPFLETVRQEVQSTAERLRNHASLAIWCGDNEIDMVYASQNRDPQYNQLTRQAIPQTLQRFDPHRVYIPSSPYISAGALNQNSNDTAEQHLWGPRGYFKGDFYTQHSAHFIGEIGYHACPEPKSVSKFISPEQLWPADGSDEWQVHSVYHWRTRTIDRDRIELMSKQIRALFGHAPENLADYALASQITQAEALKFFVESTRLRKWHTSGILWWNLLDGWPQFSDSIVDYYFTKKLAYHYLRRVQSQVLVCLGEAQDETTSKQAVLPLVVSNDSLKERRVSYHVRDADSQKILADGTFSSPANENWQVGRILLERDTPRLLLLEWQADGEDFGNHYLLAAPPLELERYRGWLKQIAELPQSFLFQDYNFK